MSTPVIQLRKRSNFNQKSPDALKNGRIRHRNFYVDVEYTGNGSSAPKKVMECQVLPEAVPDHFKSKFRELIVGAADTCTNMEDFEYLKTFLECIGGPETLLAGKGEGLPAKSTEKLPPPPSEVISSNYVTTKKRRMEEGHEVPTRPVGRPRTNFPKVPSDGISSTSSSPRNSPKRISKATMSKLPSFSYNPLPTPPSHGGLLTKQLELAPMVTDDTAASILVDFAAKFAYESSDFSNNEDSFMVFEDDTDIDINILPPSLEQHAQDHNMMSSLNIIGKHFRSLQKIYHDQLSEVASLRRSLVDMEMRLNGEKALSDSLRMENESLRVRLDSAVLVKENYKKRLEEYEQVETVLVVEPFVKEIVDNVLKQVKGNDASSEQILASAQDPESFFMDVMNLDF